MHAPESFCCTSPLEPLKTELVNVSKQACPPTERERCVGGGGGEMEVQRLSQKHGLLLCMT